jgi:hypothetical protein
MLQLTTKKKQCLQYDKQPVTLTGTVLIRKISSLAAMAEISFGHGGFTQTSAWRNQNPRPRPIFFTIDPAVVATRR